MHRDRSILFRVLTLSAVVVLAVLGSCSNQPGKPDETGDTPITGMRYTLPGDTPQAPGEILSGNFFSDWWRYPAEEQNWLVMPAATAYNRDVLVGGETYISGAADGETWSANATRPDGTTITWGNITFHSDYNGQQNCFVSSSWIICGYTDLYVLWYTNSQCLQTGTWTMRFFNNGAQFHEGTFKVLPQIPPGKVPSGPTYNQLAYLDHYDNQCKLATNPKKCVTCDAVNTTPCTIKTLGCWLTGACMILGYHGVTVTPAALNTWLKGQSDGYQGSRVNGWAVARYARQYKQIFYVGSAATSTLENRLCSRGPQLAHVRKIGRTDYHHFVTVTGQNEAKTTHLINDPAGGGEILLNSKYQDIKSIRVFEGPEYVFRDDLSGVLITFHSPGELLVTDPLGRRTGADPLTGQSYNEIPNGSYETEFLEDPEEEGAGAEAKAIEISRPDAAGEFTLRVTGTDNGTYDLQIVGYDVQNTPSSASYDDIPITTAAVHAYAFAYDKASGSTIGVSGGFAGGGQRPRDVNRFLSYVTATQSRIDVPVGATSYTLIVVYGSTIIPSSFQANLDGVDISEAFSPAPGTSDLVAIPLHGGSNVLSLSVEGNLPTRVARDTDRLVFMVPNF